MKQAGNRNSGFLDDDSFNAGFTTQQQYIGAPSGEQPVGDHADNGIEACFHGQRVVNHEVETVEYLIAVVGNHTFAVDRVGTQLDQFPSDIGACHGDDFYRQRKGAKPIDPLRCVGDADEAFSAGGHDLFPGKCRTTALDHL